MTTETSPATVLELSTTVMASPEKVWQAIIDPALTPLWLGGYSLLSSWKVGEALSVSGRLNGRAYTERGVLEAFEPGRRLSYNHWSRLWRVPDLPSNRAVVTLTLQPVAREPEGGSSDVGTLVLFRHELPEVLALQQHSRFFWGVGLRRLKMLVEGEL